MGPSDALEFVRKNNRAVLHTYRADGSPQLSPVAVAVLDDAIAISSRETAMKTKNLVRDPRATVCIVNDGWYGDWMVVSGPCEVVHLPDALEQLVEYYRTLRGDHPDWDEYRQAMVTDQRVVLRITPERVGPTVAG
jgi:PPOX class probable F420-dependent enzyme